ncbi:hypothetical protein [Sorangium sp. So ce1389]|uniref:hypothetical protein n=1 Tax=Sorangium sp. So ce1389 TaxID=3133336 RepID=UPI003F6410B0
MTTRLERFRGYMARLNPAARPVQAVRDGLYVPRPGRSTADEIAARLELDPASSHLVVGGIGSGKTTQLLVARDRLTALPDTHAEYIDVADLHDLARLEPGILTILAGVSLSRLIGQTDDKATRAAMKQFDTWAHGKIEWIELPPDDPYDYEPGPDDYDPEPQYQLVEHKPLVVPPEKPVDGSVQNKASRLSQLRSALNERFPHVVLLFDSLDRLTEPSVFARVIEADVRAIHSTGIGLALVGPLASMYGPHRSVTDHFQHFYPQMAVDVRNDAEGRAFLVELLRRRAVSDLLPDASAVRLAEWSGGVLRDLVSLARAAGEEAYMRGAECVEEEHIDAAADAFGRKLIFGLSPAEIEVLLRIASEGSFVQTSDQDVALLVTRRVLEYRTGNPRFAVHPTLRPLLQQLKPLPAAS